MCGFTRQYYYLNKHGNADALSQQHSDHNTAIGHITQTISQLENHQIHDPVLYQLCNELLKSQVPPSGHP